MLAYSSNKMETLLCERSQCQEAAIKFCINCKALLCKSHKLEDMKRQSEYGYPEHFFVNTRSGETFACLYCTKHSGEMLTRRCINCFQFACNSCPPEWCSKAAGRHHDYNIIAGFVGSYKERLLYFQEKLQRKHASFMDQLKEACKKLDESKSEFEKLLQQVDEVVQFQITALTKKGDSLKNEILHEMCQVTSQMTEKIKSLEDVEVTGRQLLHDIQNLLKKAGGAITVHKYSMIKENVSDLLRWKAKDSRPISRTFSLSHLGTEQISFELELQIMETSLTSVSEENLPEEQRTEIILTKCHVSDKQEYMGLSFLSEDTEDLKIITHGENGLTREYFIETRHGEHYDRRSHVHPVWQLLVYGDEVLALTFYRPDKHKIAYLGSATHLYEFSDSSYCYPFYYSPKLMAVTSDHQLIVLHRKTQTLHVMHLKTKAEQDIRLFTGKTVYGVMASVDGKLILLYEKERKHAVIKYSTQQQQVIWTSETLLTEGRLTDPLIEDRDWLRVDGYGEFLYILSRYSPTKVFRLNLSDGHVIQKILCDGLPKCVLDMSLRGNTLAVSGVDEGIKFFSITDITDIT